MRGGGELRRLNPIPTRYLAPIDFLKIPALAPQATQPGGIGSLKSIFESFKIRDQIVPVTLSPAMQSTDWNAETIG